MKSMLDYMLRHIKYSGDNSISYYAYPYLRYTNLMASDMNDYYECLKIVRKIKKNYKLVIGKFCLI